MERCKICDKEFIQYNSLQKYCGYRCSKEAESQRKRVSKKKEGKKCKQCGESFNQYTSMQKFCQAKCRNDYMTDHIGKELNKKQYKKRKRVDDPEYSKNKREMVKEMWDKFGYLFCQRCNQTKKRLDGHHIIFRSEKPGHKNIHSKKNIILVCGDCHDFYHKKKSTRNELVKTRRLDVLFGKDVLNK